MPRKRIGDGPSPCLLGDILLALIHDVESGGRDGNKPGRTAAELADAMGMSSAQARAAANELVRARCLTIGRAPTARRGDSGRYAQAFRLSPADMERGPARSPRLYPVGLLVEPDRAIAVRIGSLIREAGTIPIAVDTPEAALLLLRHLGFELVILRDLADDADGAGGALPRIRDAARRAGCGPVLVISGSDQAPEPGPSTRGSSGVFDGSFNPPTFGSRLIQALDGDMAARSPAVPTGPSSRRQTADAVSPARTSAPE